MGKKEALLIGEVYWAILILCQQKNGQNRDPLTRVSINSFMESKQ